MEPNEIPIEWPLEKAQWQNPRIRALLGSVRRLDGVMESNFAILHCSPVRLLEIWDTVLEVSRLLRTEITRLMEEPSALPELDQAVRNARDKLRFLSSEVFVHIDRFPERPAEEELDDLRRTLCVTIGKLHGFLLDTLGEILAADPRSHHDVDYFLARKFPRDVEEAEWLQKSVLRLDAALCGINARRHEILGSVIDGLTGTGRLPDRETWQRLTPYLDEVENGFAPSLQGVAGLHGIRFDELEVIQAHAADLPEACRLVRELHDTAGSVLRQLASAEAAAAAGPASEIVERALCERIAKGLRVVEDELRDLGAFIPLWLRSVEQRRALMLRTKGEAGDD